MLPGIFAPGWLLKVHCSGGSGFTSFLPLSSSSHINLIFFFCIGKIHLSTALLCIQVKQHANKPLRIRVLPRSFLVKGSPWGSFSLSAVMSPACLEGCHKTLPSGVAIVTEEAVGCVLQSPLHDDPEERCSLG